MILLCIFQYSLADYPDWMVATTDMHSFPDVPNHDNITAEKIMAHPDAHVLAENLIRVDAVEHFFYNSYHGIAMEMGAVDGRTHSVTSMFQDYFGWKRILAEANPMHRLQLSKWQDVFAASTAICQTTSDVHFLRGTNKFTSAILGTPVTVL